MTHVVAEPCHGCKYTDCVEACPVDCFHEGPTMLYIDAEECIDCQQCVAACPVEAIFHEDDLPAAWRGYVEINARLAAELPSITVRKEPLAGG
ncbi:MAG: ferredoxin family protein [Planctomycetia bacterium]|nr:ferredoxin family protein [Planctomycetia bacterium]